MSSDSPSAILYSSIGIEVTSGNNVAVTSGASGLLLDGYDGTDSHLLKSDTSGNLVVVGLGVAGTASGGVVTVQGVAGMTALTVNNATAANLLAEVGGLGATGSAPTGNPIYIGALVGSTAPAYTTGNFNALSLTVGGQLRVDGVYALTTAAATAADASLSGGAVTSVAPTYTTGTMNALSLDTSGNLRVLAVGAGTAGTPVGGVVTVQGITGGTAIPVSGTFVVDKSTTGTMTSVAASATSVTALASNANRIGAAFYNDSSSLAYLAVSATTASLTAFTIRLMPNSYTDLDVDYTGQINVIWATATGNLRVTEWS